jgi:hypothetical protein
MNNQAQPPSTLDSRYRVILLAFALIGAGCDSRSPTSPRVVPPLPEPPAATYTVSGVVSEMTPAGRVPVAGARVDEGTSGRTAVTDEVGGYSLTGLRQMTSAISASKDGYVSKLTPVTIAGDTTLDIEVERIVSYTLSGVVFELGEAGRVPIAGVELYCDNCGSPQGHTFAYTDANGFYSFSWTFNGSTPLFVTKPGYAIVGPTDALGRVHVTVNGDTRFDIQLIPK